MDDPGAAAPGRIDGLILAGGQSLRMRSASTPDIDKGLQPLDGRPLVAWVSDYMRAQGIGTLFISANRNLPDYARHGHVVQDPDNPPGHGPLLGVLQGLRQACAPWVFVLPVDVLRWPPDLLTRLAAAATAEHPAFAQTQDGPHPLCLLLYRDLADSLQAFLQSGERRVQAWLRSCDARAVDFPVRDCLINLNTPQDWARWQLAARGDSR